MEVFVVENEVGHEPELLVIAEHKEQALNAAVDTFAGQFSKEAVTLEKDNNRITVNRPNEEQQTYSLRELRGPCIVAKVSEIITIL